MNWGILGTGEIAGRSVAPAIAKASGSTLVAVCDSKADAAQAFAARFGAVRAYGSIETMLADAGIDGVYIATPNVLHAEQAILAARAGKHVLCEKPMATSVTDAARMIEACAKHGVTLGVVFQNRYHPAHARVREVVASGELGEISFASAQLCRGFARDHWQGWRTDPVASGAGAIVAQGVHPVDLLRFLLGSEVVRVQAMSDEAPPARPVEEMVYGLLEFANGTRASVVAGSLLPRYDNDVIFYGSRAKIAIKGTLGVPLDNRDGELVVEGDIATRGRTSFPTSPSFEKLAALIEDFTRCVAERRAPQVSGENGLAMVKIALALQQSARSGRAVQIE